MFEDFLTWRIKSFFARLPSALLGVNTSNYNTVLVVLAVVLFYIMYVCPRVKIPNTEINEFLNLNGENLKPEAGPHVKHHPFHLDSLSSFPLFLNSHPSYPLNLLHQHLLFIFVFMIDGVAPADPQLRFFTIHVATLRLSCLHTSRVEYAKLILWSLLLKCQ